MPEYPSQSAQSIFLDNFRYEGGDDLPGSETLPDHWTENPSASFTTASGLLLEALLAGELVYSGTALDELRLVAASEANYAICATFLGREDLKVEIRGRRLDANNFIGLYIDLEANTVSIRRMLAGVPTTLAATHTFKVDGTDIYEASLWMNGDYLYGFINGKEVVQTDATNFQTSHGFSINIPELNEGDGATFNEVKVFELSDFSSPSLNPVNLQVLFRVMMKEEIEEPSVRSWQSYQRARLLWERHRNFGRSDGAWEALGYPIKEPTTEQWFV